MDMGFKSYLVINNFICITFNIPMELMMIEKTILAICIVGIMYWIMLGD